MIDFLNTLALTAAIGASAALTLWGVERCCTHELRMIEKRARDREADGLVGQGQGVAVHEVKNG